MENIDNELDDTELETQEEPSLRDVLEAAYDGQASEIEEPTTTEVEQPVEQDNEPGIEAPISWRRDSKEVFASLPKDVQRDIYEKESKRERIFNEFQMQKAEFSKKYSGIEETFAPYEKEWMRRGITPTQAVKQFLAWQEHLDSNPVKALSDLAATYGLSAEDLLRAGEEQPQVDPRVAQMEARQRELETHIARQQQEQYNQYIGSINNFVESFAEERNQNGELVRPYFSDLHSQGYLQPFVKILKDQNPNAHPGQILNEAYEMAVVRDPRTRESIIRTREAKQAEANASRARNAKVAGSSIKGTPGGPIGQSAPVSIRGALEDAWDNLS